MDVVEEVLDGPCATQCGEARQDKVVRLCWVTFAGLELDMFSVFNRRRALLASQSHAIPVEVEAGLAEARNECKRFLLRGLLRLIPNINLPLIVVRVSERAFLSNPCDASQANTSLLSALK